jgi:hypothetical protein
MIALKFSDFVVAVVHLCDDMGFECIIYLNCNAQNKYKKLNLFQNIIINNNNNNNNNNNHGIRAQVLPS